MKQSWMPNPWTRLADDWPDVTIRSEPLGIYTRGFVRWHMSGPPVIVQNSRLTQTEQRCNLAHELEHLNRGRPCQGFEAWDEQMVRAATARYLLPDIEAVAWCVQRVDLFHAAGELWVTPPVLMDRVQAFTVEESDTVARMDWTGLEQSA